MYRYTGQGNVDGTGALGWAGQANAVVVMVDAGILRTSVFPFSPGVIVGVVVQGKLIPLLPGALYIRQGLGTIAF